MIHHTKFDDTIGKSRMSVLDFTRGGSLELYCDLSETIMAVDPFYPFTFSPFFLFDGNHSPELYVIAECGIGVYRLHRQTDGAGAGQGAEVLERPVPRRQQTHLKRRLSQRHPAVVTHVRKKQYSK